MVKKRGAGKGSKEPKVFLMGKPRVGSGEWTDEELAQFEARLNLPSDEELMVEVPYVKGQRVLVEGILKRVFFEEKMEGSRAGLVLCVKGEGRGVWYAAGKRPKRLQAVPGDRVRMSFKIHRIDPRCPWMSYYLNPTKAEVIEKFEALDPTQTLADKFGLVSDFTREGEPDEEDGPSEEFFRIRKEAMIYDQTAIGKALQGYETMEDRLVIHRSAQWGGHPLPEKAEVEVPIAKAALVERGKLFFSEREWVNRPNPTAPNPVPGLDINGRPLPTRPPWYLPSQHEFEREKENYFSDLASRFDDMGKPEGKAGS